MAETLERLAVQLEARTAIFERRMAESSRLLKKIRGEAKGTRRDMGGLGRGIDSLTRGFSTLSRTLGALGLAGIGAGFASAARSAIEFGDSVAKTATRLGVGAEALQELRFAAERTGVAQGTLDLALQRFVRRAGEADKGTGELVSVLSELSISTRDANGEFKGGEALLAEYADAIQAAGSDAERLRLAFRGFDSEGAALAVTLRNGSAGLAELRQEARDSGVVIDERLLPAFERANDQIGTLGAQLRTQIALFTGGLLSLGEEIFSDSEETRLQAKLTRLQSTLVSVERRLEAASEAGLTQQVFTLTVDSRKLRASIAEVERELQDRGVEVEVTLQPKLASPDAEIGRLEARIAALREQEIEFGFAINEAEIAELEDRVSGLVTERRTAELLLGVPEIDTGPLEGLGEAFAEPTEASRRLEIQFRQQQAAQRRALDEARAQLDGTRTAAEQYRDTIAQIQTRFAEGLYAKAAGDDEAALRGVSRLVEQANRRFIEAQESGERAAEGARSFFDAGRSAAEVYSDRLEQIDTQLQIVAASEGGLSDEILARADRLRAFALEDFERGGPTGEADVFESLGERARTSAEIAEDAWASAGDSIASGFSELATRGKLDFGRLARSVVADILRMQTRFLIFRALSGLGGAFSAGINPGTGGAGAFFGLIPLQQGPAPQAKGNAIDRGSVVPFADGGIVTGPMLFPMDENRFGLVGEAGPEAILPLERSRGGLGIKAVDEDRAERVLPLTRTASGDLAAKLIAAERPTRFATGGVVPSVVTVTPYASGGIVAPPSVVQASGVPFAPTVNVTINHSGPASNDESEAMAAKASREVRREMEALWRQHAREAQRPGGLLNPRIS